VAVLAAAAGALDHRCRDCFLTIPVDESPEQTALVMEAQRDRCRGAVAVDSAGMVERLRDLQRCIEALPVVVPFVSRIAFPMTGVASRSHHAAFLTLIEASALLHQHQRDLAADGAVLASEVDFQIALSASEHLFSNRAAGLSRGAASLLVALEQASVESFQMRDLALVKPDWTRHSYRVAVSELEDMGHLVREGQSGRGRVQTYLLVAEKRQTESIFLADEAISPVLTTVGELAAVGEGLSPTVNTVRKVS
jgi:hypothetical protein